MYAFNKGDDFEPLEMDLSGYHIEVVTPDIHVSTAEAYAMIDLRHKSRGTLSPLVEIIHKPLAEWKNLLINDFEKPVFEKYPELEKLKQDLYQHGAVYVSMTGSGSALFGLFPIN